MSLIADLENLKIINHERSLLKLLPKKEAVRLRKRKWRLDNPEKVKEYQKEYCISHPEKMRNRDNIRRARKLANGIFEISAKELKKLYASPCLYCGSKDLIQADHVVPVSKGGRHSIGNLVPACRNCNYSKGNKLLTEWKRSKTWVA